MIPAVATGMIAPAPLLQIYHLHTQVNQIIIVIEVMETPTVASPLVQAEVAMAIACSLMKIIKRIYPNMTNSRLQLINVP